ncbi:hypothetical protein BASA50_007058 [Batrachochytrium salamandrivorans]|uniref:TLC domain-containing protein n=1 Tax=Batrachochytrium salamandrivorans TaxID=1357716 RepID=A0ABQ8F991_9FUNG|nr:hypothetical protein BASA50_007058 [Batrachochytrium salamandrivorans]KAH6598810.1 hypothetical protein BASA61_002773 [Batrachochytrium salamandrivorans]
MQAIGADQLQRINPSFSYPDDIYAVALAIVCWGTLHQFLNTLVLKPATTYLFPLTKDAISSLESATKGGKSPVGKADKETALVIAHRKKFMVAAWKFVFFSTSFLLGVNALARESWTFSPRDYFVGWPNHPMSTELKTYYIAGIGCSFYTFVILFMERLSMTDVMVMLLHHCTTLFLLSMSFVLGCHRAGAVILTLHDASDPLMELAKMSLYTGRKMAADIFFVLYAAVFIGSRLVIYPLYVASSVRKYAYWTDGSELPTYYMHYAAEYSLWTLQALHIYWGYLILSMLANAIFNKGVSDDVRSKDD